jgi:hypothetical protein
MVKFKLNHGQTHSEPDSNCMVTVSGKCKWTGKDHSIRVNIHQLQAWKEGIHIQVAMPHTSPIDREFLVSGLSPEGWEKTMESIYKGDKTEIKLNKVMMCL